jgi:hypothetical protein
MRFSLLILMMLVGLALAAQFGTVQALSIGSPPAQFRLRILNSSSNSVIRVSWPEAKNFPVSTSGEVVVDVPRLPGSCSLICCGIILRDGSPYNRKVIEVLRDGRLVRKLSLRQLQRLPLDSSGARKLAL